MRLDQQPPSSSSPPPYANLQFLSMKEICALTGYSRTHIYRMERAGTFIRRRKIGLSKIAFLRVEYEAWVRSRPVPDLPPDLDE